MRHKTNPFATLYYIHKIVEVHTGRRVADTANCHFEFHQLVSVPRYKTSKKLADFFEMSLDDIISELEDRKAKIRAKQ
jgi:hypothetical protein